MTDNKKEPDELDVTSTNKVINHSKMVGKLLVVVLGMFGFGFALVPLYDVFCDLTGLNGKTANSAATYEVMDIDESRTITIDFITRTNSGMAWQFEAQTRQLKVHPGQMNEVNFTVKNPTRHSVVGQAVPSVSPGTAALFLNKTECFCFEQQVLQAGESVVMPMRFYVDPQLPDDITYFTLQYTLYDVTATSGDLTMNSGE
ncbi:cytochrome c oxidase assembly protein [Paraglaciecola polaris]|uniref:Cytochrome c oxidase assembly protein CtaG n=1 Tax=Paraglaciecola polaris LMG 21857 TaxID=1129793 RepID=K6ZLL3_9ALTE|nr:cytochrome c oxidase assembly protein [Paraglaciecola polaris]GAC31227.1 cytochrome c oxidase assembly protein ctaG [Paraglaciecola polaris LMG 21857]|tara:strand:- start:3694 stop:4296 length:603 start_codon:yes stop_codon:yes gene_type:complete